MADSDYIQADLTDEQRLAVMAKIVAGASPQDAYVAVLGSRANDKTRDYAKVKGQRRWKAYQKSVSGGPETIVISDNVRKLKPGKKPEARVLVITTAAFYKTSTSYSVKRRVELSTIPRITESKTSNQFVVHVPSEWDFWVESKRKGDIIAAMVDREKSIKVVQVDDSDLAKYVKTRRESSLNPGYLGISSRSKTPPSRGRDRSASTAVPRSISDMSRSQRSNSVPGRKIDMTSGLTAESGWFSMLEHNYKWAMYLHKQGMEDEKLQFADAVTKINSRGKQQRRLIAITDRALYNLTEGIEIKRRVELKAVTRVTTSTASQEFVVHVPSEYDYWFSSVVRDDVVKVLERAAPHIQVTVSMLRKLGTLVQTKSKGKVQENHDLPPIPSLRTILSFNTAQDKREHTRAELVTTEQTYCSSLVHFLKAFAYPLDNKRTRGALMHNRTKWVDIFDNFENIVRFHCDFFCPDLQQCVSAEQDGKASDIGKAFRRRVSLLKKVYEPYLANWSHLQEQVKKLHEKSKYTKFFKRAQDDGKGLGINDYLIMPIQRIPRYVLLIQELVKHTDHEHPEYTSLQMALKDIQKIAKVCDSYIR